MTDFEKQIYNTYITITRRIQNKPSRKREDFTNFELDSKYISVKRLATLFTKHKEINIQLYFEAPYKIYKDATFFDLNYYASPRAIKAYTLYKKEIENSDPDLFIEDVKKSLLFLANFCVANSIQLTDYISTTNGAIPQWVEHIKLGTINPYCLMELTGLYASLNTLTVEEQTLLLGSFGTNFFQFRDRYNNSRKLKITLQKLTHQIKNTIYKHLQNKK
jgi:hypothetical protein